MKKRMISLIIAIIALSTLIYIGLYFTDKIDEVQLEYDQTGIDALKILLRNYTTSMFVLMLYTLNIATILMKLDTFFLSKSMTIINNKKKHIGS